jgi:hypothetical protein
MAMSENFKKEFHSRCAFFLVGGLTAEGQLSGRIGIGFRQDRATGVVVDLGFRTSLSQLSSLARTLSSRFASIFSLLTTIEFN